MESGNLINVAMGFDANYAPHAASTIASIVRWTQSEGLRFVILHPGIDKHIQRQVERVAPGARFDWVTVDDGRKTLADFRWERFRILEWTMGRSQQS